MKIPVHLDAAELCSNCGAELPVTAKTCAACGSYEETGWSEEVEANRLNLPEERFDYDDFIEREFGKETLKPRGMRWLWWWVAVGLLAFFVWKLVER